MVEEMATAATLNAIEIMYLWNDTEHLAPYHLSNIVE